MGFVECRMPHLTHVLGPVVDAGSGKPQTVLLRRLSIIRELIDALPPFDFFAQALDSPIVDGLAFQDRGFHVSPQYTFEIDCRCGTKSLWDGMHSKTRQHIRRAGEKFSVERVDDPGEFVRFYTENLRRKGTKYQIDLKTIQELFVQSVARDSGEILSARWPDGRATAMTYIVWGHGRMPYFLSTRADDAGDNGSVNLLIWSAMQRAHTRGLLLDLDGVCSSGTARFLSGFNGAPKLRMVVRRTRFRYRALQYAKRRLIGFRTVRRRRSPKRAPRGPTHSDQGKEMPPDTAEQMKSWVVPLRSVGSMPPLFCAGGDVAYRDLVEALPETQPVYAFGVPPFAARDGLLTVQQLAAICVREVRGTASARPVSPLRSFRRRAYRL